MAQTFHTRFTSDVSQHTAAMRQFRQDVGGAVSGARAQLLALGAIGVGGWGIKEVSSSVIKLAADMQSTKVAFEVMLGSADKAKKVLGDLTRFADVTPFQTDEVIRAGRQLLAAGTATEDLTKKLTLLGNIAAGTNMPLNDMVSLYAKMANKGKAQTEELNQMAERGIPIYRLLTDMLKINQEELVKMAEGGQLSFALISEALEKLGGKGGQYFGLIEKQSKTLSGLWSTLEGNVKMLATSFGELMIPQLSEYLDKIIAELDRMKATGELDANMKKLADTLMELLRSAVELGKWLAENRETLLATGKVIAYWMIWNKLNATLQHTSSLIRMMGTSSAALNGVGGAAGTIASQAGQAAAETGKLAGALAGIGPILSNIALAAGVAFTGWEIGKQIAEVTKLEDAFTRMFLKAKGKTDAQIDKEMKGYEESQKNGGKAKPSVETVDLVDAKKKKDAIANQLKDYRSQLANLDKSKDPNAKKMSAAVKEKIQQLEADSAAIDKSVKDYEANAKQAALRKEEILKESKKLTKPEQEAQKKVEDKQREYDKTVAKTGPPMTPDDLSGPGQGMYAARSEGGSAVKEKAARDDLNNAKAELKAIRDRKDALGDELRKVDATKAAYIENKKRQAAAEKEATLKAAQEQSAAEEAIAKRKAERAKQIAETQKKIAEERKKLAKDMQSVADEKYHDSMSEKIKKWQEDIDGYRKKIAEAEKALQKFGLNIEDDILKTPQQIAQARKDEQLKTKLELHNAGMKVNFTDEEKARVAELQAKQKSGRDAKKAQEKAEGDIKKTEKDVDKYDRTRKEQDWKDRAKEMQDKSKSLDSAGKKIEEAQNNPNASLEKIMKDISDLLKKGLPNETK